MSTEYIEIIIIKIDKQRRVIWFNTKERCILRASNVPEHIIEDFLNKEGTLDFRFPAEEEK